MKYCSQCGKQIHEGAIFCPECGARQGIPSYGSPFDFNRGPKGSYTAGQLGGSRVIAVLSFFVPLVGVILWYMWRYSNPGKSRSAAKGALSGLAVSYPIVGLVAWLFLRESDRELSKVAGISAIIGGVISVVSLVISNVLVSMGVVTQEEILNIISWL